nr:MAG TPA: hypothetical protein [Caudoviricetes sp.]
MGKFGSALLRGQTAGPARPPKSLAGARGQADFLHVAASLLPSRFSRCQAATWCAYSYRRVLTSFPPHGPTPGRTTITGIGGPDHEKKLLPVC